jgi:hypothetical protein
VLIKLSELCFFEVLVSDLWEGCTTVHPPDGVMAKVRVVEIGVGVGVVFVFVFGVGVGVGVGVTEVS